MVDEGEADKGNFNPAEEKDSKRILALRNQSSGGPAFNHGGRPLAKHLTNALAIMGLSDATAMMGKTNDGLDFRDVDIDKSWQTVGKRLRCLDAVESTGLFPPDWPGRAQGTTVTRAVIGLRRADGAQGRCSGVVRGAIHDATSVRNTQRTIQHRACSGGMATESTA